MAQGQEVEFHEIEIGGQMIFYGTFHEVEIPNNYSIS
jgi:hypothetical protein